MNLAKDAGVDCVWCGFRNLSPRVLWLGDEPSYSCPECQHRFWPGRVEPRRLVRRLLDTDVESVTGAEA